MIVRHFSHHNCSLKRLFRAIQFTIYGDSLQEDFFFETTNELSPTIKIIFIKINNGHRINGKIYVQYDRYLYVTTVIYYRNVLVTTMWNINQIVYIKNNMMCILYEGEK